MNTLYKTLYIAYKSFWTTLGVAVTVYALMLMVFPISFWFGVPAIVGKAAALAAGVWLPLYARLKWVRIYEVKRYVA